MRKTLAMRKERTELLRFRVGENVLITAAIMSRRCGQRGKIVSIRGSSTARTLDKYVVLFQDNAQETFWDIQLQPESKESHVDAL